MGRLLWILSLCTGYADIMVDPIMSPWDALPLIPIIKGAGGKVTDYEGNDPVAGNSMYSWLRRAVFILK